ncbi:MAG: 3-keto-5-aminohexanoate cleavage protein [Oscillospiraceae bacterium]|nr:3-keto-5-aminohexanoate cleavage protein [Oscillospiraceae bacterium]
MAKTIITVAPTGAWPTKKDNPNIPLNPKEIAADVVECYKAGAAICHLHMRDEEGRGSMSAERFQETVDLIKAQCDIVINCTTSGAFVSDGERMAHLPLVKPDIASYDCGTMNWMHNAVFTNTPQFLEQLGRLMIEHNIKPEIEIFDAGMIYNSIYYAKKGVLKTPMHYQFVLGAAGGMAATVENLVFLRSLIPEGSTWGALGIGKGHVPIMLATVALGGHLRVGMEDNVLYGPGQLAESNAQFVKRAADLVRLAGNEAATPDDARQILSLTR